MNDRRRRIWIVAELRPKNERGRLDPCGHGVLKTGRETIDDVAIGARATTHVVNAEQRGGIGVRKCAPECALAQITNELAGAIACRGVAHETGDIEFRLVE